MERVSTAVRFSLAAVILAAWVPFMILVLLLAMPFRKTRLILLNKMGRPLSYCVMRAIGANPVCRMRKELDCAGPAIFVSNHGSSLDMFVFGWACRPGTCAVAKRELTRAPFVGPVIALSGFLLIDRKNPAQALSSMQRESQFLRESGLSCWVMPEGTRSLDGSLAPFKRGFVHMALQSNLPVIPIAVHNAHKVWPMDRFVFTPGDVEIEMLEQFDTSDWSIERAQEHADSVRLVIAEALEARPREKRTN